MQRQAQSMPKMLPWKPGFQGVSSILPMWLTVHELFVQQCGLWWNLPSSGIWNLMILWSAPTKTMDVESLSSFPGRKHVTCVITPRCRGNWVCPVWLLWEGTLEACTWSLRETSLLADFALWPFTVISSSKYDCWVFLILLVNHNGLGTLAQWSETLHGIKATN